jgi:hypothetical protein
LPTAAENPSTGTYGDIISSLFCDGEHSPHQLVIVAFTRAPQSELHA